MTTRRLSWLLVACGLAGCDPAGPGPVALDGGFVAVAGGGEHSCGITVEGSVYCWGSNVHGQLGSVSPVRSAVPIRVAGEARIYQEVSAAAAHTCALDVVGRLYCWGGNAWGQLGTGSRSAAPAPVAVDTDVRFRTVSAGTAHTCGLSVDDRLFCWGSTTHGQAGATGGDLLVPVEVIPEMRYTSVSAGGLHTCALDMQGEAHCWGSNTRGQLGDGTTSSRPEPRPISGGARYSGIAAGHQHTCATVIGGTMHCWGSNEHGELGEGVAPDPRNPGGPGAIVPYAVQGVSRARFPTTGRFLSCGLMVPEEPVSSRPLEAWCWGSGSAGQVGTGSNRDHYVAQWVRHPDLSWVPLQFLQLSAGAQHVCGVTETRIIFCWGRGDAGQLGTGSFTGSTLPVQVTDGG